MRILPPLLLLGFAAGCGTDGPRVRGSLATTGASCEEQPIRHVMVEGGDTAAVDDDCRFDLALPDSSTVVLAFLAESDDDDQGRMHLAALPSGVAIEMADIWIDEGNLAFPRELETSDDQPLLVNGLRLRSPDAFPDRFDGDAVLLALDEAEGALLVRPVDGTMPDLRVRLDPAAEIQTMDGEPGTLSHLSYGDSLRIEGEADTGVLLASRLLVPEAAAPTPAPATRSGTSLRREIERAANVLGVKIPPEVAERIPDGKQRKEKKPKKGRGRRPD